MNRLLIIVAGAAGACAIAVPATIGLSDNPSFSQGIPVRVPTSAHVITFDDHGKAIEDVARHSSTRSTPKAAPTSRGRESESGDDNGTHSESGDDRGTHSSTPSTTATSEPGEDNRGRGSSGGGHGGDDGGA